MMLTGHTSSDDLEAFDAAADRVLVSEFNVPADCLISKLSCYMDGAGSVNAVQSFKAVIYDSAGALVGEGAEVVLPDLNDPVWLDLPFARPVPLSAGDYSFGIHCGSPSNAARAYKATTGTNLATITDTYADGAPATISPSFSAGELGIYATFAYKWTPPDEDDLYLANLGYHTAQAVLGAAESDRRTKRRVVAGWHGTLIDPEPQGASLGIVQLDGLLTDWVGERVRVTNGTKSTVVFIHRETDLDLDDDTQISLSRRAWMALALPAQDTLQVTVETIPAVEDGEGNVID